MLYDGFLSQDMRQLHEMSLIGTMLNRGPAMPAQLKHGPAQLELGMFKGMLELGSNVSLDEYMNEHMYMNVLKLYNNNIVHLQNIA